MVDQSLTSGRDLQLFELMRSDIALPAAFFAALGLVAATAPPAHAASPIAIEGADEEQRKAILRLLPDREPPADRFGRGISEGDLRALVADLERM